MKVELNNRPVALAQPLSSVKFTQFAKNEGGDLFFHTSSRWQRIRRNADGGVEITAVSDGGSFTEAVEVLPYGTRITLISEEKQ